MIIFYHAFQLAGDIMEKKSRKQSAIDHTFWDIDIQLIDKELQVPLEVEALKDSVTKIDWGTFFHSLFSGTIDYTRNKGLRLFLLGCD